MVNFLWTITLTPFLFRHNCLSCSADRVWQYQWHPGWTCSLQCCSGQWWKWVSNVFCKRCNICGREQEGLFESRRVSTFCSVFEWEKLRPSQLINRAGCKHLSFRYNPDTGIFTVPPGGEGLYYFSTFFSVDAAEYAQFEVVANGNPICRAFGDASENGGAADFPQAACSGLAYLVGGGKSFIAWCIFYQFWQAHKSKCSTQLLILVLEHSAHQCFH